ncbi:MAG: ornithine cyclodeaminase family protein [Chloroflexota bacterium]
MQLHILSAEDVRQALPMAQAISSMKGAYGQLSAGEATVPLRTQVAVPRYGGVSIFMPAYLTGSDDLAVKIVSVFPENAEQNLPTIHGLVLALDAETGRPLALLEGGTLTAIRTGAGSGAATDLLARPDASIVAIIGSGVQARTQLEAVCTVRDVREVRVYSLHTEHARTFAREMAGQGPIPDVIEVVDSAARAVQNADIICTATTAARPVFSGELLSAGAHINAVGSFRTDMQEVDVTTIRRSLVVVDSRDAVMAEAGDIVVPLEAGEIDETHIHAELGQIINGERPGRSSAEQVTYFKSVGVAVQDAVAASLALTNAQRQGLGTVVEL